MTKLFSFSFLILITSFGIIQPAFGQDSNPDISGVLKSFEHSRAAADAEIRKQSSQQGHTDTGELRRQIDENLRNIQCQQNPQLSGCGGPSASGISQECLDTTEKATRDCNFEGNSGVQGVMGLAGQLKSAFDQMAAANPQLACSKLAQLSTAASAASGAFNTVCSVSYDKCQTSCEYALTEAKAAVAAGAPNADQAVTEIKNAQKECRTLAGSLQKASDGIATLAGVNQTMAFCQSQTGDSFAAHCLAVPTDPFCATAQSAANDCSNPATAASNTVCICQRNPNDPKCGSFNKTNFASQSAPSADGELGKIDSFGTTAGDFGSGINDGGIANPNQPAGGSLALGGSGGRGGGGSGGGGNSHGGNQGGGTPGSSGLNAKIVSGYGIGGRGGSGFSGGSGSSDPRGGTPDVSGYSVNGKPGARVDLKQFLPGGQKDPARGLAGVSGPDGITGPNSNIWQKVNARYFSVSPSLLP